MLNIVVVFLIPMLQFLLVIVRCIFILQAGSFVRDDAVPSLVYLVSTSSELQGYAVQSLYKAMQNDISQVFLCPIQNYFNNVNEK